MQTTSQYHTFNIDSKKKYVNPVQYLKRHMNKLQGETHHAYFYNTGLLTCNMRLTKALSTIKVDFIATTQQANTSQVTKVGETTFTAITILQIFVGSHTNLWNI